MAQTKVKLIADGVIVQGNLHASHGITTAHIGEGSNLYYTDARVSNYLSTNGYDTATNIIASITDSAPSTLDTLNELAAALGDDANFSTTVTNSIALKAPLASPTFTGSITTPSILANSFMEIRSDTASFYFENAANNNYYRLKRSSNDFVIDYYNGTTTSDRLTIDSSGNVGIGTSSPGYPLEVNGRVAISSASTPQLMFFEPGRAYTEAMRLLRYEDKLSLTYGWNANEEALTIVGTGSTAGYVGIGTTSPTNLLTINDPNANGSITDTIPSWWGLVIDRAYTTSSSAAIGVIGGTVASGSSGRLYLGNSDDVDNSYIDGGANQLHFSVGGEKMRITSDGNFGFNETTITNPYGQSNFTDLNIDGTWGGVISFKLGGTEKGWIGQRSSGNQDMALGASSGQNLLFYTNGVNERMRIDSLGKITSTGASEGVIKVVGSSASHRAEVMVEGAGQFYASFVSIPGSASAYGGIPASTSGITTSSTPLVFATNNTEKMRITSGGDVLIGTNGKFLQGKRNTGGVDIDMIGFSAGTDTLQIKGGTSGAANAISFYDTGGFLGTWYNGNFGIKITSPFSRLQSGGHTFSGGNGMYADSRVGISNHGLLTGMMLASTYNDVTYPEYGLVFVQGPSTSSYNVWSISPDGPAKGDSLNFIYGSNATNIHAISPKVVFDGNGNVGIGTASPSQQLELGGILSPALKLSSTTTNGGVIIFNVAGADKGFIGSGYHLGTGSSSDTAMRGEGALVFLSGGNNQRMFIASTGNVGIGTTSPAQKLDVNGQMTHDGLVLKTGTSVYIDTIQTIDKTLSITGGVWTNTGIEGTDIGATGSYMIQVYSNAHGATGGAWYSMYWTGVMSWYKDSSNGINTSEIYLNFSGHALNSNVLQLRTVQHTSSGTPANLMSLEIKTSNTLTNAPISFRFRRLM